MKNIMYWGAVGGILFAALITVMAGITGWLCNQNSKFPQLGGPIIRLFRFLLYFRTYSQFEDFQFSVFSHLFPFFFGSTQKNGILHNETNTIGTKRSQRKSVIQVVKTFHIQCTSWAAAGQV